MSRSFLGDEVHQIAADLAVARTELESTKLALERKEAENGMLRRELTELKGRYEEKSAESVAIQTLLEGMGHQLALGLTKYREERAVRQERNETKVAAPEKPKTMPPPAPESEYAPDRARKYGPPAEPAIEKPLFLRSASERGDVDHPLLPPLSLVGAKGARA